MNKVIIAFVLTLLPLTSARADGLDDQWAICQKYLSQQALGGVIARSTDLNAGRWTSSDVSTTCEPVYLAVTARASKAAAAAAAQLSSDMAALKLLQATPAPTVSPTATP